MLNIFQQNNGYTKNPTTKMIKILIRSNFIFFYTHIKKETKCKVNQEDSNQVIIISVKSQNKVNSNSLTF